MNALPLQARLLTLVCLSAVILTAQGREARSFDSNWFFHKGDIAEAKTPAFDDSIWRRQNVPHDWSIEGPFSQTNRTGGSGGFLPSGVGWYRKHFTLPAANAEQRVYIEFDGVMANSDVWINGQHLGMRPNGYVSFSYELTPHLKFGLSRTNVIAVRTDTSGQPASRWYTGAGIYRHVRLVTVDPVHFTQWGSFVTTDVNMAQGGTIATTRVQCTVTNQSERASDVSVRLVILAPNGHPVATNESPVATVKPGAVCQLTPEAIVRNAKLWNLESPKMYQAVLSLISSGKVLDTDTVRFGIRHFEFRAATGFWLNGRNFKLKGVCLHHDGGAFGAAVPLGVWEQRLRALRELGVNAIRTAHNPPAPDFLDLCDKMGFIVMDEFFDCWTLGKTPYDYHLYFTNWSKIDLADGIRRDRNHPSIVIYSVGNEIRDTPRAELAKSILSGLVQTCHENDPTRPVTQALFRPNMSHDYDNGLADLLDVIGTNYRDNELLAAQRAKPDRKIIGTEQRHDRQTWLWLRDNPSHSGQFLWTGVDYLGESRRWPVVAAGSGLLDRTGEPRPLGYERQSWWSDKPMVYIARRSSPDERMETDPGFTPLDRRQTLFPDWSPKNLNPHPENVEIYSNCEEVELFINGKSFGIQSLPVNAEPRLWRVDYQQGVIRAVGMNHGRVVATNQLRTAGSPATIELSPDQSSITPVWNDVVRVVARIVDDKGATVPSYSGKIHFNCFSSGKIAAVDNGNNSDPQQFFSSESSAFQGKSVVWLRAGAEKGTIRLQATSGILRSQTLTIKIAQRGD